MKGKDNDKILMDWYLIRNSQIETMRIEQEALADYVDRGRDSMERIDRQLSEIFFQDGNFRALQRRLNSVMEYSHAYDLEETLHWRMMVDESLSGYFIYYGGKQNVFYRVKADVINASNTRE